MVHRGVLGRGLNCFNVSIVSEWRPIWRMMASHKHSRRQLPSLSVEIADKQRHSLISHMTYKSSLEYLLKNEGTFTKALELIKRYPTLADHRSTAKIWEILSLGTKSCSEKPHSSWNGQAEKPKLPNMPTISISSDGSSDVQCASCTRHEKMHIGIVGISFEHTETLKWKNWLSVTLTRLHR